MRLASTLRNPTFLTASLVMMFTMLERSAEACQVCVLTNSYNIFRFAIIWYLLLFIWIIAALTAGITLIRTKDHEISRLSFARSSLLLLAVAVVLVLLGLPLIPVLYFPFILLPYSLPHYFRAKKYSYITHYAPKWLRTLSRILLAGAILSSVPSYFVLPRTMTEAEIRDTVSRTRENLRSLANLINAYRDQSNSYPPMVPVEYAGETYTALDPQGLSKIATTKNEKEIGVLLGDPFAFSPIMGGFIGGSQGMFTQIQYYQNSSGFVLWGRGPDTEFSSQLVDAFTSDSLAGQLPGPTMLTTVAYDPTNGTIGPGDIFYAQQH